MRHLLSIWLLFSACHSPETAISVISDTTKAASCVSLTTDEKNQPVISWCEEDEKANTKSFFMAFYNNGFSSPMAIPIPQPVNLHEEGMPKLAIKSDGTIVAVYEVATPSPRNRFAGVVQYIVSHNKGKSWTAPAFLHADTTAGSSHSFASLTRLPDGEIGACWLDAKAGAQEKGRPVKFAKTTTGNRFASEVLVDSIACECCRTAITADANGHITIAFRDIINDSIRDMSMTTSTNNGRSFSPAVPFSNDGWVLNGCPHNGPAVATTAGKRYAAWFTGGPEKGVYYCELNNKMEFVSRQLVSDHARFIQLCLLPDGSRLLAFDEKTSEGKLTYNKIKLNKITGDKIFAHDIAAPKSLATYPVVKAFADKIIIAWSQDKRIYYTVIDPNTINTPIQRTTVSRKLSVYQQGSFTVINKQDPVCGMRIAAMPADTAHHHGRIYGFCSDICKSRFLADADVYVSP